ncbi:MAG: hypothetical protein KAH23_03280 [Kiritimatiellae bacterium]|nr:hypothetical protein [Kiritimatiellia bacterium]
MLDGSLVAILDALENILERSAFDILHRIEDISRVINPQLIDGHYPRMLKLSCDLSFFYETQDLFLGSFFRLYDHLHCHITTDVRVLRRQYGPHPATGNNLSYLIFLCTLRCKDFCNSGSGITIIQIHPALHITSGHKLRNGHSAIHRGIIQNNGLIQRTVPVGNIIRFIDK